MATNYSCVYISDRAYKELLDFNNVNSETFYVVHYEDVLPGVSEPIIDVYLGKHRLSAIINLDSIPSIDISRYVNINVLKSNLKEMSKTITPSANIDTNKIEKNIDDMLDTLADSDVINNQSMIPTNIGQSNKLYLYFDKVSRKYQMFVFHPTLNKFIPLKLDPISIKVSGGGGSHSGGGDVIEQHLHIDNAVVITSNQVSTLDVTGESIGFDIDTMSSVRYSSPNSNIVVQGLICNSFANMDSEELYKNFSIQAYYNNTMYNFNIVSYLAEYGYLINDTFKLKDDKRYYKYIYNLFDADDDSANPSPVLTLDGYIDTEHAGSVGMCINVKKINSPEVDSQLFPNGYVDADLLIVSRPYLNGVYKYMTTLNSEANFTTYLSSEFTDLFDELNDNHYVIKTAYEHLISKIEVKLPFKSLAEYRFNIGLTEFTEVTEE